jgi:hypothetical protein
VTFEEILDRNEEISPADVWRKVFGPEAAASSKDM